MKGAVGSLNAAVAGSILLFEAVAQRDSRRPGSRPPRRQPDRARRQAGREGQGAPRRDSGHRREGRAGTTRA